MEDVRRLHIGGDQPLAGWINLNVLPGPHVDIVANATDLGMFGDATLDVVYASHILEHLDGRQLGQCLAEIHRVLKPGCRLLGGVPDLEILCRLWLENRDIGKLMKIGGMIFGGHINEYDIHHLGFDTTIMAAMLLRAGFAKIFRVEDFDLLEDQTGYAFDGTKISLNFIAEKAV
jgi:predicted SAM-dependent methyltransferase